MSPLIKVIFFAEESKIVVGLVKKEAFPKMGD